MSVDCSHSIFLEWIPVFFCVDEWCWTRFMMAHKICIFFCYVLCSAMLCPVIMAGSMKCSYLEQFNLRFISFMRLQHSALTVVLTESKWMMRLISSACFNCAWLMLNYNDKSIIAHRNSTLIIIIHMSSICHHIIDHQWTWQVYVDTIKWK